ncbi:hypothetical protein FMM80_19155 [Schaedlerella arabinosiphila]|uniref:Uncharacterized protein n=1 Tax=Schaedlerella arabinosiphila TaxID=2044587 RepID=A0A9X5CD87_9FIRM|nr:hypothetical protein [Schaedlerella arabinosiphila]
MIRQRQQKGINLEILYLMKRAAAFNKIMYLVQMLMYGKEASNRKQAIDRQHHTMPTTTESLSFLISKSINFKIWYQNSIFY